MTHLVLGLRRSKSVRRGFTLVEMLVVIAIITILMALLLPTVVKSREAGRSTECKSNLRQLYLGLQGFYDVKGYYPPYRIEDSTVFNRYGVNRPRWQWIIADQLGRPAQNPDLVQAELAAQAATGGAGDFTCTTLPLDNEIFFDPALPDQKGIRNGAYGYAFQYLGNSRNLVDGDPTTPTLNYPVRRVRDPSRTICFGDSRGGGLPHGGHAMTLDPPHMRLRPDNTTVVSPSPSRIDGFDPYGPDETGTDIVIYFSPAEERHNGRANVVFLDGHVESQTLEDLGYVVVDRVARPMQATPSFAPLYPLTLSNVVRNGNNRLWTGNGLDETSPNFNLQ